nr:PREDICTED: zinc finger protein 106 [Lepisosteus oculatus]
MGKERKCILCHIVYNSKKEMDEHMRSMLHHRELENLKGRDCDHECRVCGVEVVGLTAYANHISSPLHKSAVKARDREDEGKDECEEEYFDRDLIQLIEQRREQSRREKEEAAKASLNEENQRHQQRNEERQSYLENQSRWHHQRPPPRNWGWDDSRFPGNRKGWGNPCWQSGGGPSGRHPGEGQGNWHENRQGRNASWHPEGSAGFSNWYPGRGGGNWGSKWGFNGFLPLRDKAQPMNNNYGWNRFYWDRQDGKQGSATPGVNRTSNFDFNTDNIPMRCSFHYRQTENLPAPTSERSNGKNLNNAPKDKPHRWAPYPPSKFQGTESKQTESRPGGAQHFQVVPPRLNDLKINFDFKQNSPQVCQRDQAGLKSTSDPAVTSKDSEAVRPKGKSPRRSSNNVCMPSVKSGVAAPSEQSSILANESLFKASSDPKSNLSALNLETGSGKNTSYVSKLRSASSQNSSVLGEHDSSLTEMLRKAKEVLKDDESQDTPSDQAMEEQAFHFSKDLPERYKKSVSKEEKSKKNDLLEDISDGDLSDCGKAQTKEPKNKNASSSAKETSTDRLSPSALRATPSQSMSLQSIDVSTSSTESTALQGSCTSAPENGGQQEYAEGEEVEQSMQGEESQASDCDLSKGNGQHPAGSQVPDLSKLGLPALLQRDLTRHITPKSKTGTHEPNLNIARRIRNISGPRKSESEKDSGLKPTLRQLISSSGSRRNVNWDQVYQQVSRKKQEQGKGQPRFGIEMVTPLPSDLEEGADPPCLEGFQWEDISVMQTATTRKRSLSESSVVMDRPTSSYCLFTDGSAEVGTEQGDGVHGPIPCGVTSDLKLCPPGWQTSKARQQPETGQEQKAEATECTSVMKEMPVVKREGEQAWSLSLGPESESTARTEGAEGTLRGPDSLEGDSSCTSGTEQNDTQGVGKKRRAAADVPSPEVPALERKNKRRKIKSKKERTQVDQLLSISLREEELNSSLQGVDASLLQARAALQAAYIEVQQLLVLKQQVTMEMSTLRTKRIEILQGMQEGFDGPVGEELAAGDRPAAATHPSPFSPTLEGTPGPAGQPPPTVFTPLPLHVAPLAPLSPADPAAVALTVCVKQEPVSPGRRQPLLTAGSQDPQPRPSSASQDCVKPVSCCSPSLSQPSPGSRQQEKASPTSLGTSAAPDRPGTRVQTLACPSREAAHRSKRPEPVAESSVVAPSPETKSGKRVKKLKKKKSLRKASDVQDNSDTEQDGDSTRPTRKAKSRKIPKGGRVSTSTSLGLGEEEAEQGREARPGQGGTPLLVGLEQGTADSDSSLEVMEVPRTQLEVVSIDSSGDEKQGSLAKGESSSAATHQQQEAQKLGCDEVSSTSELGTNSRGKNKGSKTQVPLSSVKGSKNSSEVSSEPGEEEEPTEGAFEGHQAAVNSMQIHNGLLYTCSGDKTVRAFSLVTRKCVAVFEGHTTKVNCLMVSQGPGMPVYLYTGASDHTIRCYNVKTFECVEQFCQLDRVLCLHSRWKVLYAGLANGTVVSISLKTNKQLDVFECHAPRAVSCIATAQEGARRILLVGSYDCTISVRDAKSGLLLRTLEGHTKTVLCMKVVNDLVFSGSSDQSVHAHNIHTGELVRIYKGHSHAVTVVTILGNVMVTACLDKLVRVYELQSHDRLQVYGGHKDMVMCMAIHKSMIYTGCYDGSVQAVRLNLMQNYRCWWHGCSLIFGVVDHLKHHLLTDHTNPNFQTLKCRWRNCDAFFTVRNGSKLDAPRHMQKHAEEDSKVDP